MLTRPHQDGNGHHSAYGDPVAEALSRLEGIRPVGDRKWMARCPAHDDRRASLSVTVGHDGRVLLNCHAKCSFRDICRALGMEARELFASCNGNGHNGHRSDEKPAKMHRTAGAALPRPGGR